MTNQELRIRIEDLVWHAWSLGQSSAHPMTPHRKANEYHAEVNDDLNELLNMIDECAPLDNDE